MENQLRPVLELAAESHASDIHIKTGRAAVLRIGGDLIECNFDVTPACMDNILQLLLNNEKRKKYEETGDVDLSYAEKDVGRFRVNVHRQRGTPAITMRFVKSNILNFAQLGLPPSIAKITEMERGIVFVTGTTGSGKSTTLASIINNINELKRKHIITIEDPIEYEFSDINSIIEQREVGLDTVSFDSAFISSLRQDPDIIVIGEMRGRESFDCALKAADTGHLVFSTLHTSNASQSINRILDLYDASEHNSLRQALSANLAAVVSQRLIPKANGKGVAPAVEIMFNTPTVAALLIENKLDKLPAAIEGGRNEGMQSFNQSLMDLIKSGTITEEAALHYATNTESLKMNLKGVFLGRENKILG